MPFLNRLLLVMRIGSFTITLSYVVLGSIDETDLLNNRKENLTKRSFMLSAWRDIQGNHPLWTLIWSTLPIKLHRLKATSDRKLSSLVNRKSVVLYHDNARLHTAWSIKVFLEELGVLGSNGSYIDNIIIYFINICNRKKL